MKKLLNLNNLYDALINIRDVVLKRCRHYDQRIKWHDEEIEEIEEIESDIKTIERLITILFLENIAIILLLIIWSW